MKLYQIHIVVMAIPVAFVAAYEHVELTTQLQGSGKKQVVPSFETPVQSKFIKFLSKIIHMLSHSARKNANEKYRFKNKTNVTSIQPGGLEKKERNGTQAQNITNQRNETEKHSTEQGQLAGHAEGQEKQTSKKPFVTTNRNERVFNLAVEKYQQQRIKEKHIEESENSQNRYRNHSEEGGQAHTPFFANEKYTERKTTEKLVTKAEKQDITNKKQDAKISLQVGRNETADNKNATNKQAKIAQKQSNKKQAEPVVKQATDHAEKLETQANILAEGSQKRQSEIVVNQTGSTKTRKHLDSQNQTTEKLRALERYISDQRQRNKTRITNIVRPVGVYAEKIEKPSLPQEKVMLPVEKLTLAEEEHAQQDAVGKTHNLAKRSAWKVVKVDEYLEDKKRIQDLSEQAIILDQQAVELRKGTEELKCQRGGGKEYGMWLDTIL